MVKSTQILTIALLVLTSNSLRAQQCQFRQVSSKAGHSLGISEDGKLYGWGSNAAGQLGLGTSLMSVSTPTLVNQDTDWKKVETGNSAAFSVALKNNGSLWFMGLNINDVDTGLPGSSTIFTPTQITPAYTWKDFSTGFYRIIGIRDDNTLWGWGNNEGGSLGVGNDMVEFSTPTQIGTDNDWTKVSCGTYHTLAQKSDGTLWVCGFNHIGQLGNGSSGNGSFSNVFVQVGTDNDWLDILAAAGFNLAIKSNGTLWGWGYNETSQLGNGNTVNVLIPTQIGLDTDWKSIGYSGYSSAAIKNNGTLWTWGFGFQGQLGNGMTSSTVTPAQIGTDTDWKIVTGGGGIGFTGTTNDHYLALKNNNTLFSWGVNTNGVLGNNTISDGNIPASICNTVNTADFLNSTVVNIFPNPTNAMITVESNEKIKSLTIMDALGTSLKYHENTTQLDVSEMPAGAYYLRIQLDDNYFLHKLVSVMK